MKAFSRHGKHSDEDPQSSNWNRDDCHWTFLMFSMGLFLCITTSLIMITELSSFALLYQNRNLLISIYDEKPNTTDDTTIPSDPQTISTSMSENSTFMISTTEAVSEIITSSVITVKETTQHSTTPSPSDTTSAIDSTTETEYQTTSAPTEPPEIVKKKNPIIILEEQLKFVKTYSCYQSCLQPIVNIARLNASLSAGSDNFITLSAQVTTNTTDMRFAKRKVAHMALQYLFADYVKESTVDPEWSIEIPSCEMPGNRTWTECQR